MCTTLPPSPLPRNANWCCARKCRWQKLRSKDRQLERCEAHECTFVFNPAGVCDNTYTHFAWTNVRSSYSSCCAHAVARNTHTQYPSPSMLATKPKNLRCSTYSQCTPSVRSIFDFHREWGWFSCDCANNRLSNKHRATHTDRFSISVPYVWLALTLRKVPVTSTTGGRAGKHKRAINNSKS